MRRDVHSVDLTGRRVVVTGASQGLGRAISERLLAGGASVFLTARDPIRLAATSRELASGRADRVAFTVADVRKRIDLDVVAEAARTAFGGIDSIVCNAGIWGPKGRLEDVDVDEWCDAFAVNVFGVAHTVRSTLPMLRASGRGRIVIMSGGGATKPMAHLSAYAASKSATVRLGETLADELREDAIPVNMIAPGAVNTNMLDDLLAAGIERIGAANYASALKQRESGGTPPERGADLCAWLLSDAATGITGKLISAVWDPWETLDHHRERLAASDIYTLRRIVPEDRSERW
jgi:NAD(P)-dependent dehydrogenase (short-subunit alcohol dehydrogenase family)